MKASVVKIKIGERIELCGAADQRGFRRRVEGVVMGVEGRNIFLLGDDDCVAQAYWAPEFEFLIDSRGNRCR